MLKILSPIDKFIAQEQFYTELRKKEGRMYTDEEVKELPKVNKNYASAPEWKIRGYSAQKLVKYLKTKNRPLRILEIGCGNGWFSNQLSRVPGSSVTGLDVNMYELEQADRVFASVSNLGFVYGDILEDIFPQNSFDVIVFAASIQYFSNLVKLIEKAMSLLNDKGEIHIIDTPFYKSDREAKDAKERSISYFKTHGVNDMANYYNHHTYSSLQKFKHKVTKPPLLEKLSGKAYFPSIIIT